MTWNRVKYARKSQTKNCAHEECTEDELFLPVDRPRGLNEKIHSCSYKHDTAQKMSPWKEERKRNVIRNSERGYQMFPVSVWSLKIDLKHAPKVARGGRCPLCKKSLSWSQLGRCLKWTTFQLASQTFRTKTSACSAALWARAPKSISSDNTPALRTSFICLKRLIVEEVAISESLL